jgi:hypothetical protein
MTRQQNDLLCEDLEAQSRKFMVINASRSPELEAHLEGQLEADLEAFF